MQLYVSFASGAQSSVMWKGENMDSLDVCPGLCLRIPQDGESNTSILLTITPCMVSL